MQTGQLIAKLRREAGLTQLQLAEQLFVSRDLVSKWETGQRRPDYPTVCRIAQVLACDPDLILSRSQQSLSELADCIPAELTDPECLTAALNAFLGTLRERDRCVFVRRYYYFEDAAQIGEQYGIRENYVRTLLTRTRRKLRRYLKEGFT